MLPPTRTVDATESLHGESIDDPYRWLEDETADEVRDWAHGRDSHCRQALAAVPGRETVAARLTELAQIGRVGGPTLRGGRLFYWERTEGQDQPVLCVRDTPEADGRVLLDPNTWADDATVALDWWHPSGDGIWIAYGQSAGGTEVSTLRVLRTDGEPVTGAAAEIAIERCRAADVAWLPDHSGFYYTRYPRPGSVPKEDEAYHRQAYFHALDAAPDGSEDAGVFGAGLPKERWVSLSMSPNGNHLAFMVIDGWSRSDLWTLDRTDPDAKPCESAVGIDALFQPVPADDGLYVFTNQDAPRGRIMRADWAAPARDRWTEVVPEGPGTIEGCVPAADRLVVRELRDAAHALRVYARDGSGGRDLALPMLGTIGGCDAEPNGTDLVFDFQSFTVPPALYRCDLADAGTPPHHLHAVAEGAPDPGAFAVQQVRYPSKDGTEIPMFIGTRSDATAPGAGKCLLYGYGGFNVSLTPTFSASILAWIERGGVFALANIRGGGEYGEDWHRAGMLADKQNCFDDFAAAADWLVEQGWTTRDRLAIQGGSNGGLLAFVTLTQRPDLCRAAISQVPLADMLRYHRFQIARLWIPEYGDPENPEHYPWLRAYSPYHHVQPDTRYPATLVMTGESDTRVDPLHARKMAAALEAAQSDAELPILLRVERKAGHGQGMPLSKAVEGLVDAHCFLEWQLR